MVVHGSVIQETETQRLPGLHSEETLGAGDSKMVQEIKVLLPSLKTRV